MDKPVLDVTGLTHTSVVIAKELTQAASATGIIEMPTIQQFNTSSKTKDASK